MKYRVVGWTEYDDDDVEAEDCSEAALQAIILDIKENGYEFSGYGHQELSNGAPVLNDGKKRLFSQRGFGGVMAMAHGDFSRMGYANYAFHWEKESEGMPDISRSFSSEGFVPETELNEEFEVEVVASVMETAAKEQRILLDDCPSLLFLDIGDTLTLTCEENAVSYLVKDMERKKDLPYDGNHLYLMALNPHDKEKADQEYNAAKWVLDIVLLPIAHGQKEAL